MLKKNTFVDKKVGEYFNKNFINIGINGETREDISIVKKYKIESYPTILIIDKNEKVLTLYIGYI